MMKGAWYFYALLQISSPIKLPLEYVIFSVIIGICNTLICNLQTYKLCVAYYTTVLLWGCIAYDVINDVINK